MKQFKCHDVAKTFRLSLLRAAQCRDPQQPQLQPLESQTDFNPRYHLSQAPTEYHFRRTRGTFIKELLELLLFWQVRRFLKLNRGKQAHSMRRIQWSLSSDGQYVSHPRIDISRFHVRCTKFTFLTGEALNTMCSLVPFGGMARTNINAGIVIGIRQHSTTSFFAMYRSAHPPSSPPMIDSSFSPKYSACDGTCSSSDHWRTCPEHWLKRSGAILHMQSALDSRRGYQVAQLCTCHGTVVNMEATGVQVQVFDMAGQRMNTTTLLGDLDSLLD